MANGPSGQEPTNTQPTNIQPTNTPGPVPGQRSDTEAPAEDTEELARVQAELDTLRNQVDKQGRRRRRIHTTRRVVAAILVVIAALGTTATVVGLWAARTTLNTDRWVSTVAPLPDDPAVTNAVSIYVTNELVRVLDVEDRVAEALPPKAAFIAGPVSNGVRDYMQKTVADVMSTDAFRQIWSGLNRTAHEQILAILNGDNQGALRTQGGTVTLNLLPVVNNVLATLEQRAPSLFGRTLDLPQITNGQVPPGLQTRIESALGVELPANFSKIRIYNSKELGTAQQAVDSFKRYLALLVIGTLVALALALWISPTRRRTTLQYGVWLAVSVLAVATILRAARDQILGNLPAGPYRDGGAAAVHVIFTTLRQRADQLIWLGILIAVVAYLVGPGSGARWVRRKATDGAHAVREWTRGVSGGGASSDWVREHLDPLRIGGLVVAGGLAFLVSSWTSLFVLAVLLAGYELAVTLIAQPSRAAAGAAMPGEAVVPDARGPAAAAADAREPAAAAADAPPAASSPASPPEQRSDAEQATLTRTEGPTPGG